MRKIRSGRSGALERSSMAMNESTSTTDAASSPIVVALAQPSVVARVSA